ncbi:flagellar hook-associated protein 2 [Succinivibrio dextrinosolvens DSM 3072]|uniref:Flagellar hook-associated protein 2 n=1 Tax=Succinivibrio dextrinosolvens DSM 3072 TaxID=1123324 RepID=A0A1T4VD68_9GAMM|nr:flagellar filament capping protein FliD [Succinivibrio dextrinosolvens]SKA62833.1 flagellar hook-associated protein 2 [Succinivibrio dextrinosolvens DSM 3072]
MASIVTNAGTGSGNDFESIISAMVSSRKNLLNKRVTVKKAEVEIEQQGVSKLTSALKSFKSTIDNSKGIDVLNTHKITTSQSSNYTAFSITAKSDCSNTSMSVAVNQLAKAESISTKIATKSTKENGEETVFNNSFEAGTLTISLGQDDEGNERSFEVEISEGDTLELIRRRINTSKDNSYGVSCNVIKTSDGYSFSLVAGETGLDTQNLSISVSNASGTEGKDSLSLLAVNHSDTESSDSNGKFTSNGNTWTYSSGQDAVITVDGNRLTSHTNEFKDQIAGVEIVAQRESEKETVNGEEGSKSYQVDITSDDSAAAAKIQSFVNAYNSLMSTLNTLTQRNTYTDGKNNYDGGDLAGDSQVKALQNNLISLVTRGSADESGLDYYSCGLEYNKDGTLSLDTEKFSKALNDNINAVERLFTDSDGLIDKISDQVYEYTKFGGLLTDRETELKSQSDYWTQKENRNTEILEAYEASLRTKYGNLDSLMASYQTSLSYLSNVISSVNASSKSSS